SILVLVRKEDPDVLQREPVFFARADKTGPAGADIKRANDLNAICLAFEAWRKSILNACAQSGLSVPSQADVERAVLDAQKASGGIGQISLDDLDPSNKRERLDEAYWCMKRLIASIPSPVSLSKFASFVSSGREPPEQSIYPFASVVRAEGRVRPKGDTATTYSTDQLQEVREGDILLSGIDLVHGSAGVVGADCDRMVVSKEYFILRAKDDYDPYWLVSLLRTGAMRRIIEGIITGTSNRTRVESPDVLMSIGLPDAPDGKIRARIGDALRAAHGHHSQMTDAIKQAEVQAAKAAALPFDIAGYDDDKDEGE
ncbi:MAG TPA: hypothetical protein VGF92_17455, partial [Stellaceae bacterium]